MFLKIFQNVTLFTEYLVENYYSNHTVIETKYLNKEMAVKHIVREVALVLIITVISITVALFIANNAQSEPLRLKDNQWHHHSKDQSIIHGADSGNIRITDVKIKKKL